MAMSVVYTTFGGMLVHENRGGTERQYISDPMGSLVGELDSTQAVTYTAEYWPYGEIQAETGTNTSAWSFVGLLGYLKDLASLLYVRARHYLTQKARWLTVDPFWPGESAYGYGRVDPISLTDPSGLSPILGYGGQDGDDPNAYVDWLVNVYCGCGFGDPLICYALRYTYGKCCGLTARCSGPDDGLDCLDKACGAHDACLPGTSQYLSREKQCECLKNLCDAIGKCSCRKTRHPRDCMEGKKKIGYLYCILLPLLLKCGSFSDRPN